MGNEASVLRLELANRDSQTTCWTQVHIPDVGNQMGEPGDGLTQIQGRLLMHEDHHLQVEYGLINQQNINCTLIEKSPTPSTFEI